MSTLPSSLARSLLVPFSVACFAALGVFASLIDGISTSANQAEHDRTSQVVTSAIMAFAEQLSTALDIGARRNETARKAYASPPDYSFLEAIWGRHGEQTASHDFAIVFDSSRHAVSAVLADQPMAPTALTSFDARLAPVAANIAPVALDVVPGKTRASYVALGRFVTPEMMDSIGARFAVTDLKVIPLAASARSDFKLSDKAGRPVVALNWTDRRSGDMTGGVIVQKAFSITIYVLVTIGAIAWRLIRRLRLSQEREAQSQRQARQDPLSGLPNRARLVEFIESLDTTDKRTLNTYTVTFVDLDDFKHVNDTYGHEVGDQLIKAVSAGFKALLKGEALLSRLGGDEFAIVHVGPDAARFSREMAANILRLLAAPFDFEGRVALVGASIGIADLPMPPVPSSEMLRRADIAMYHSKHAGRGQISIYDPGMDNDRVNHRDMASELRDALRKGEIAVAYQPYVDVRTRRIKGVEALVRWDRPGFEPVPPDVFVTVAEQFGFIDELGQLVMETALRDAARWPELTISVNISPVQFRHPLFFDSLMRTVIATGFDPRRLEIELTETHFIERRKRVIDLMDRVRACGIKIALDDFGAGYSSVGYLRQFKFDKIKIDRSLVQGVLMEQEAQTLLQATVLLGRSLNMTVTAEGVEKEEELALLRLTGCNLIQGYLISKPLRAAELEYFVQHNLAETCAAADEAA